MKTLKIGDNVITSSDIGCLKINDILFSNNYGDTDNIVKVMSNTDFLKTEDGKKATHLAFLRDKALIYDYDCGKNPTYLIEASFISIYRLKPTEFVITIF